jgi:hypothetical protein
LTRRGVLLAVAISPLLADDSEQVWDLLTGLASALSEGNPIAFLKAFDRKMPGYEQIERDVTALLRIYTVQSSIEIAGESGEGDSRSLELDWLLSLIEQQNPASTVQRDQKVRVKLTKQGKTWHITSLEPLSFLAPPKP